MSLSSIASGLKKALGPGDWYPVPGFYFKVMVVGIMPTTDDCSFKEVSGIDVQMEIEAIDEGGVNSHQWNVPKGMKYSNLVLKRGVLPAMSYLSTWIQMVMSSEFTDEISPKNIVVILFNESGIPLYSWAFANAVPVKWTIDPLDAMKNEYLVESIEFQYQYFKQVPVAAALERAKNLF